MEIIPLAPKVNNINGAGNKSDVGNAQVLYIVALADDVITNVTTGGVFQMHENQAIVIHKNKFDLVHTGATTTHVTKIAYPRG